MIPRPMMRKIIPRLFLNQPRSSAIPRNFATIDLPHTAIRVSMRLSQRAYIIVYPTPTKNDTGNTVARSKEYVGEQVENTGPRAAPVTIALSIGFPMS